MDKRQLYEYLCSLPNVVPKDDWWCCTQCVLCGDSKKNPYKKRLYIHCDPMVPEEPVWYKCFNCNACSILTKDMLDAIADGAPMEVLQALRKSNKTALDDDGSKKVNRFYNRGEIKLIFPPLKESHLHKYRYLCKERLGIAIPPEDFQNLKIVWSLKDFIQENHLTLQDTGNPDITPALLERDYIGFASVNNEYINFRDTTGKNKYRWYKYNVFGMEGNLHSFYAISNQVNLFSRDEIHIIVAEGTLDTLGILYHIYGGNQGNNVFLSTCNGSFETTIHYYIRKGLLGSNIWIDCYIDNDTKYNFKRLQKKLSSYVNHRHIRIFHNRLRKDFGYPANEIDVEELTL